MIWSSSLAIAMRADGSAVSVAPWTSRSCARLTYWVIESSEASVESIQPWASWMLRTNCSFAPMLERRPIAWAAMYGSSDGRVISFWEAALDCVLASELWSVLRSARTLRWTMEVVMRMGLETDLSGAVDEDVQHLVHRRHGSCGGLVGALEAHEVGHLLVHRDTGHALAAVLDGLGQHLRVGLHALCLVEIPADPGDERLVGAVDGRFAAQLRDAQREIV